jgi:hypothetical protein
MHAYGQFAHPLSCNFECRIWVVFVLRSKTLGVRNVPISASHDARFSVSFGENRRSEVSFSGALKVPSQEAQVELVVSAFGVRIAYAAIKHAC